jgi:predicted RNA-binding protein associated with RNAse of E/G family
MDVYRQAVLHRTAEYTVTFLESAEIPDASHVAGSVILEPGSPVVWFTYPGAWFDIGRFHLADGTFTGTYANILTPVVMGDDDWNTTDLFLDVWAGADGEVAILDDAEFQTAREMGWVDEPTAAMALETATTLANSARVGEWPPDHVTDWPLERALYRMDGLRSG